MDCLIVTIGFLLIGIFVGYLISLYFHRKGMKALEGTNETLRDTIKEGDMTRYASEHGTTVKVLKETGSYDGEERNSTPKP